MDLGTLNHPAWEDSTVNSVGTGGRAFMKFGHHPHLPSPCAHAHAQFAAEGLNVEPKAWPQLRGEVFALDILVYRTFSFIEPEIQANAESVRNSTATALSPRYGAAETFS